MVRSNIKEKAFSLIEMAMVIAISGLMLSFALQANQSGATDCYVETRSQIQTIRNAIETFAQKNDRLPLPALVTLGVEDPQYGHEGAAASQTSAPAGTPTSYWGQVPFQALGLPNLSYSGYTGQTGLGNGVICINAYH